jgi:pimeloyl-ACP methyl ester esterase
MPHIKGPSGIDWFCEIEGHGETLIFLHGWGVDRRIWRQQTKFFTQFYQVISFDLPGHGESSWIKVPLDEMGHDLSHILAELKVQDVTLVASSLGGLFALKMYEFLPHLVKRMVFVGSMPKFSKSDGYPHGLNVAEMRKLSGQLNSSYPSIVHIFFRSLFTQEERESRRFRWLQKFKQTDEVPMQKALAEYLDILEQTDLRSVLETCQLPMQYINGTEDTICSRDTVTYLKRLTPHARFDDFHNCGHFPFLSKPYEFNELLYEFLKDTQDV